MLYKLTDATDRTRNDTQWGPGITHRAKPGKGELCSEYYIHAYTHPLLAVFLNPIHGDFRGPHLWECRGRVAATDHGLKVGCKSLTTIRRIDLPVVNDTQRAAFGIFCAKSAYTEPDWIIWADNWLSGLDRSEVTAEVAAWAAAEAAARAARAAAWAAAEAAARAAAEAAARAAAWAAADIDLIALAQAAMSY